MTAPGATPTADLLALLDTDPAEGLRRAADRLEVEANELTCGCGIPPEGAPGTSQGCSAGCMVPVHPNPAFALAMARQWRTTVDLCARGDLWLCPDLRVAAEAAAAYLGGAA